MNTSADSHSASALAATSEERRGGVEFDHVTLAFEGSRGVTIKDISLTARPGEFVSIIGPSGCGKSTLLNLAAGLLAPTEGEVRSEGEPVDGPNVGVAYVTQDANLLPWLRVANNVALPLRFAGIDKVERDRRVREWMEICHLAEVGHYFPRQLSGGMQKRASIARALVQQPAVVLMDEPFGPLDALTRLELQQELLGVVGRSSPTVLFVTHDVTEAISLSDTVVVMGMNPGTIRARREIPIARPRDLGAIASDPVFQEVHDELLSYFGLGPGTHGAG